MHCVAPAESSGNIDLLWATAFISTLNTQASPSLPALKQYHRPPYIPLSLTHLIFLGIPGIMGQFRIWMEQYNYLNTLPVVL